MQAAYTERERCILGCVCHSSVNIFGVSDLHSGDGLLIQTGAEINTGNKLRY